MFFFCFVQIKKKNNTVEEKKNDENFKELWFLHNECPRHDDEIFCKSRPC